MTESDPNPVCWKCGFFGCHGDCAFTAQEAKKARYGKADLGYRRAPANEANDVSHPPHYCVGKIEVIDFIVDQGMNYCLGNVVKYVCRADHKGSKRQDLEKAKQYIDFELEKGE